MPAPQSPTANPILVAIKLAVAEFCLAEGEPNAYVVAWLNARIAQEARR